MAEGSSSIIDHDRLLTQSIGMSSLFEDPITFDIMEDAHITKCGHTFSKGTISDYINDKGACPICNRQLTITDLTPNYKLNEAILKYKEFKAYEAKANGGIVKVDEILIPKEVDVEKLKKEINPKYKSKCDRDDLQLIVEIVSASSLPCRPRGVLGIGANRSVNPYCIVLFGDPAVLNAVGSGSGIRRGRVQKTSTVKSTSNPIWEESFIFEVKTQDDDDGSNLNGSGGTPLNNPEQLKVQIWDERAMGKDVIIGEIVLGWSEISRRKNKKVEWEESLKSVTLNGTGSGKIGRKKRSQRNSPNAVSPSSGNLENIGSVKFTIRLMNLKDLHSEADSDKSKDDDSGSSAAGSLKARRESIVRVKVKEEDTPAVLSKPKSSSASSRPTRSGSDSSASSEDAAGTGNDSAFAVACPYEGCGETHAVHRYPTHVKAQHISGNQKYVCPICTLMAGGSVGYSVNDSTNLYNHIVSVHGNM